MAAVDLGVPGREELSCSRRGPWPRDTCRRPPVLSICPHHACPSGVTFLKQLWPFAHLLETSLAFSTAYRRKARPHPPPPGLALRPFMRHPSSAWSSAPGPRPRPSSHTIPQELGVFPPHLCSCCSLCRKYLPLSLPWQTCSPIKSICKARSKVSWASKLPHCQCPSCPWNAPSLTHILSQNIHQIMGLTPHWTDGCSSLSPVPSTEFGDAYVNSAVEFRGLLSQSLMNE